MLWQTCDNRSMRLIYLGRCYPLHAECSVFVGNIPDSLGTLDEALLESAFGVHGYVEEVFVRRKGEIKTWAIV